MSLAILGLGTAVPARSIKQPQAVRQASFYCCRSDRQVRALEDLYRRTEIKARGSVLLAESEHCQLSIPFFPTPESPIDAGPATAERMSRYAQEVVPLAVTAAKSALLDADLSPATITHLITISCTGFFAPGLDSALIKNLQLRHSVQRFHLGFMGCHGALNGLKLADAVANSQPDSRILLCAAELCSLHFQYGWSTNNLVANSLFADGAAALVASRSDQLSRSDWQATAFASQLIDRSQEAMTWTIGNNGFTMSLSPLVPSLIREHLPAWIDRWLSDQQLSRAAIASWAVHPGGPRILDAVAECLSLPYRSLEASREVLSCFGNMSSPTILFILDRLRQQQAPRPCVALCFGPGLTFEAALFA